MSRRIEPMEQEDINKPTAKNVLKFLFGLSKLSPIGVALMILMQLLFAVLTTTIAPIFVSKLLAQIAHGSSNFHDSITLLIGYIITLILGDVVSVRITIAIAYKVETKMQEITSQNILKNQTNKSYNFHANHMSGGIVSDSNKLISSIERFWDNIIFTITPIIGSVIAITIALSFIYWQYAMVLLFLSVSISLLIIKLQSSIFKYSKDVAIKSSIGTAYFSDVITNISAVKAFAREAYELKAYKKKINDWKKASLKEMRSVVLITGGFGAMMVIMNISAFVAAILATKYKLADIATIYLVINYTLNIVAQLWSISQITRNYIRIVGDASPMVNMLNEVIELNDPIKPQRLKISRGEIRLNNVNFGYERDNLLFANLNLTIKPGEKIGLVGHSGSGKTTLTKLLLRFNDITSGSILIDNQDITKIKQTDLRSKIAYVPQESMLFHRSISENIAYGNIGANKKTIKAVARLANADDFIKILPAGYNTLVGERGIKLSGGQRQRIVIARALIKNAPIIILDEATSALDSESEVLIQNALWKLMDNRTALVVAHRLSTIQKMDRILVMENGKIIEEGSHKELINKTNSVYARLWAHQTGGFIK